MTPTIRRRLKYVNRTADGASIFSMYSRSREGTEVCHIIRIHSEHGEFSCTCEHFQYRRTPCAHIHRAWDWEQRQRLAIQALRRAKSELAPSARSFGAPDFIEEGENPYAD